MLQHGDGRAIGISVCKALFELGGVILAQQINPLTQRTPIGEAEHGLSNYRGSLHFWGLVHLSGVLDFEKLDGAVGSNPAPATKFSGIHRVPFLFSAFIKSERYLNRA